MELYRDGRYDIGGDRLHIAIQTPEINSLRDHGQVNIRFAQNQYPGRIVKGWDLMDKVWINLEDTRLTPEPEITTDPGGDIYVGLPNDERLRGYPRVMEFTVEGEQMEQFAVRGLRAVFLHNLAYVGEELFPAFTFDRDRL